MAAAAEPVLRRRSYTEAGEAFRRLFVCDIVPAHGHGPDYLTDLKNFITKFKELTETTTKFSGQFVSVPHEYAAYATYSPSGVVHENVGIICMYQNPSKPNNQHAVAYVKINENWYTGDNEKGVLVLRERGPPLWTTVYGGTWPIITMVYFYKSILLPSTPAAEPGGALGVHGKVSFRQHISSCWGDSIQTVIMNANGFREQFTHLYTLVTQSVELQEGDDTEILQIKYSQRFCEVLGFTDEKAAADPYGLRVINLLSLSFIRMAIWEHAYPSGFITHIEGHAGNLHQLRTNATAGGRRQTRRSMVHKRHNHHK